MIGQMAIAKTLRGFSDLGRSVTPIFLSIGHFFYRYSTFCEKMKKSIEQKFEYISKRSIEFCSFDLFVYCASVSNASLRVKVCENDGNIRNN